MPSDNSQGPKFTLNEPTPFGESVPVLPGVDCIRLPLPIALNHVNCWRLHSDNGRADSESCIIDTGFRTKEILAIWDKHSQQHGWPTHLLVTHYHPDHSGLAGLFAEHGTHIMSSEVEWGMVKRLRAIDDDTYRQLYADWFSENEVEQSYIDSARKVGNGYRFMSVTPPESCEFLTAGQSIEIAGRTYTVLTGQGHAPDMIMLFNQDEKFLIAADQILPSITPNVSWMPSTPDPNPLSSFMACLSQLRELPEETLVLPSHGLPFTGLHTRIDYLLEHHRARLEEIEQALKAEHTAAQLFPLLFKRKLDNQQVSFALGETLAHLRYMEALGQVICEKRDGVNFYRGIA